MPEEVLEELIARPDKFAERVFGDVLWSKQREVLQALGSHEKVAVKSAHGTGKTWLASRALYWFMFTRCPALVPTTAPTWFLVDKRLWKEVNMAWPQLPAELRALGTIHQTTLEIAPGHEAYGISTDRADRFTGEHGAHLMAIVDEASGVDDDIFEALDTWAAGGEYRELLIGNPTRNTGKFYRAFQNPALGYYTVSIPAHSTPAFTGEDVPDKVKRLLIQPERVAQWKADWGEDSPAYQARVNAEFPEQGAENILVPLTWFERAVERGEAAAPLTGKQQLGVDVARFGSDRTSIAGRIGGDLNLLKSWAGKTSVTDVAGLAKTEAEEFRGRHGGPVLVLIDEGGVGAGVVDILSPQSGSGITYQGVNFGSAAIDPDRFVCRRDELMWGVRELFRDDNNEVTLAITATGDAVGRLGAQVSAVQYGFNERAKVKVESKEHMRERHLPSPDELDAVGLAFAAGAPVPELPLWMFNRAPKREVTPAEAAAD